MSSEEFEIKVNACVADALNVVYKKTENLHSSAALRMTFVAGVKDLIEEGLNKNVIDLANQIKV